MSAMDPKTVMQIIRTPVERHLRWQPACGGTEQPFKTRTGRTVQYLWCPATGEHAYYDVRADLFLTHEEARDALGV